MLRYFVKRLAAVFPLVLLVSLICFALMQATPGGPSSVLSDNPMVTPSDAAQMRSDFGYEKPVLVQFGLWLKRVVLHGDFGRSHVTGEPVLDMIKQRLPASLELMGAAPFPAGSEELNNLEYFLTYLSNGLPLAANAWRPER